MPLARDTKVLGGEDPAAWINDRRGQRPLVRIDPDHVARMIGRDQQMRRSRTAPLRSFSLLALTSRRMLLTADRPTTSRWTPPCSGANAPIRSGRSSKARTEADTSSARHPSPGVRSLSSQASVQPSSLREPSPARAPQDSTPGSLCPLEPPQAYDRFGDISRPRHGWVGIVAGRGEQPRGSRVVAWLRLSDTGSDGAGGGAAALLLAGYGRLASTGRIELHLGVRAVRCALPARSRCTAGDAEMLVAPSKRVPRAWGLGFRPFQPARPLSADAVGGSGGPCEGGGRGTGRGCDMSLTGHGAERDVRRGRRRALRS